MIPKMRRGWARLPMLVAGVSLASILAAAQTPPAADEPDMQEQETEEVEAAAAETAPGVNDADIMKDIDVSKLDWSLLNVDASTLADLATKGGGAPKGPGSATAAWSANERSNGTSARPPPWSAW